ncbi:hypothetical protein [Calothrix sp. PCC 7507]|uniref:hypothetical protein n=1 Tax=Calothrix sp. PCC 7507 TaxID=99598 RepID=UPI00029EDF8E|nr:hypothetical protein [Calothrix sp. PCC 7507]AFY34983.1 hypothetical protein Cal7507_4617 [Calothrix sp. PCC 7507]
MKLTWKLFLILLLSVFATASAGVYINQIQPTVAILEPSNEPLQHMEATQISQDVVAYPERNNYKTILLDGINSTLQGSDPATLALNAFDDIASVRGTRKVEVVYPQRNQALVTITQTQRTNDAVGAIKYRVEMTTFGRSLFVSSPPVWQIVWAGSQVQCLPGSRPQNKLSKSCQ